MRFLGLVLLKSLALFAALSISPSTPLAASFTGLGDLPGGDFWSRAYGISADGRTVVGQSKFEYTTGLEGAAFVWDQEHGMRMLDPSFYSQAAYAVSADGSKVVGSGAAPTGPNGEVTPIREFVWSSQSGFKDLGPPNSQIGKGAAFAISPDGSFVAGGNLFPVDGAFVWDEQNGRRGLGHPPEADALAGVPSEAHGISADGSKVVGVARIFQDKAFIWDAEKGMQLLLPGVLRENRANGISGDGSTVVGSYSPVNLGVAFRWTVQDGVQPLWDPNDRNRMGAAIATSSDGSTIVGWTRQTTTQTQQEAFVWTPGGGVQSLRVLLSTLGIDMSGWQLVEASAVSADGMTIAGYGLNPEGHIEAWVAAIPEPSTSLLIFLGLAGLGIRPKR